MHKRPTSTGRTRSSSERMSVLWRARTPSIAGVCFSLFLLAHVPSTAHSQELVPGDTIRVRASQSTELERPWIDGAVVRLTPDTLWYRSSGDLLPMSLGTAQIKRSSLRDHRGTGTLLGALAGGAAGGVLAYRRFEPEFAPVQCNAIFAALCAPPQQLNYELLAAAKGGAVGALLGGTVGWLIGRGAGRWETVEVDRIRATDGVFSLSLRIGR